jgi:DNA-binding beta-propeller fold protein YncE
MYDPAAGPDVEGRLTIGRGGETPGTLRNPTSVAVDGEGNVYVVDGANGRLQKFAPDGRLLKAVGGPEDGDIQFNQPGDVALDAEGNVYVADTWNHRVQKFDAELNFVTAWGGPTTSLLNPGPLDFWGPRGVAVDAEGNVWIVDTGTHRVRKFSPDGEPLATVGERGRGLGQFREPVGIAFDPTTGDFLVADAGNARIQRFDAALTPLAAYPIEAWQELHPANKPDLAVLPDGRILASDGPGGSVLLLDSEGIVVATLSAVREQALAFPRGLAYDAAGGFVFVSELTGDRVRRFPLTDFAVP